MKVLGLCKGRHVISNVLEYVFDTEIDPTDIPEMNRQAAKVLAGSDHVDLYVTGLSVALLAVVRFCIDNNISLTCYHYNRDTGEYYPQQVVVVNYCGFCGQPMGNGNYCQTCGAHDLSGPYKYINHIV